MSENRDKAVPIKIEYDFEAQRIYGITVSDNGTEQRTQQARDFPREFPNWDEFRFNVASAYNGRPVDIRATCKNVGPDCNMAEFRQRIRALETEVRKGIRIVNGQIWRM